MNFIDRITELENQGKAIQETIVETSDGKVIQAEYLSEYETLKKLSSLVSEFREQLESLVELCNSLNLPVGQVITDMIEKKAPIKVTVDRVEKPKSPEQIAYEAGLEEGKKFKESQEIEPLPNESIVVAEEPMVTPVVETPVAMPVELEPAVSVIEPPVAMPVEPEPAASVIEPPVAMPVESEPAVPVIESPVAMPVEPEPAPTVVEPPAATPVEPAISSMDYSELAPEEELEAAPVAANIEEPEPVAEPVSKSRKVVGRRRFAWKGFVHKKLETVKALFSVEELLGYSEKFKEMNLEIANFRLNYKNKNLPELNGMISKLDREISSTNELTIIEKKKLYRKLAKIAVKVDRLNSRAEKAMSR